MDWKLFVSTFTLIFVAEFPDKTAFATLLMAARGNPWSVLIGTCAAFFIQSLVAILFGRVLSFLPEKWVHFGAGLLFLAFAFVMLRRREDKEDLNSGSSSSLNSFWRVAWSSFMVIFIAEWGDITQLATASLEAQYKSPLTIFISATLALWTATAIVIVIGSHAKKLIRPALLNRISAVVFVVIGGYFIVSCFQA